VPCGGRSERFTFAQAQQTLGHKLYSLGQKALAQLLEVAKELFTAGQSHSANLGDTHANLNITLPYLEVHELAKS
jgi:hypothetical protein